MKKATDAVVPGGKEPVEMTGILCEPVYQHAYDPTRKARSFLT
jgi:hypothetical protein